ncbi:MAG: ATP-grasp domain-containing protein [Mammaliicoccus vitulinus]
MKIAIHNREKSFSNRWIKYCEENNIPYKLVNAFDSNIIEQIRGCNAFMWHFHHAEFKDVLVAKRILYSLEHAGVKVFPNFRTVWHFDDKVAQKYLLEAIDAPLVPSYVFYDENEALTWAKGTTYPKVFKLRGGAGSKNVLLVKDLNHCKRLIRKAFKKGFSQHTIKNAVKDDLLRFKKTKEPVNLLKALGRPFIKPKFSKMQKREKGYFYLQDFLPNNKFDIRIIIIGEKAFGFKRLVRDNDFRASGSGQFVYDKNQINMACVEASFKVNEALKSQSVAFDFVFDENNNPLIVEISYGFLMTAYDLCPGYWDSNLKWNEGKFNPQGWMIEGIMGELN